MGKKWKNKNFLEALINSIKGIGFTIKTELNIKIQLVFMCLVIIAGFVFKISLMEWGLLVLTIFVVLFAEMTNTAIENTVDLVTEEYNEKAKVAKDVASGAVLLTAIMSVIIGLIIFLPKILLMIR